ncbi:hypothetical protein [Oribacterium sp.]
MNILRFKDNDGKSWVRISKAQAKKLFESGEKVCFCPCKMRPFGWINGGIILEKDCYTDFDDAMNMTLFCNCNHETGKYVSFYKQEV